MEIQREYRFAVVFYGGVSLAVYENGVARALCDAVRGAGFFGPLRTLLGANVAVDVISGASAGGINGLLLAAALESGGDFSQTAGLWRENGGLQELLKDPSDGDEAQSFLNERYYLEQLREAFRRVSKPAPSANGNGAPKEIDVFVTATDLNGQRATFTDSIGSKIDVKNHALLFHMKHRQGRARLGLVDETITDERSRRDLQADTLASIARITSSFPGAFPPFTFSELRGERPLHPGTGSALNRLGKHAQPDALAEKCDLTNHHLIDGGVLENSPFGPVLEAIFHRMPSEDSTSVERTLFYVEPDPKLEAEPTSIDAKRGFTPVQVALNSLFTLPSYDGIAEDVRRLFAHNDRVRRAIDQRMSILRCHNPATELPPVSRGTNPAYHVALLDSLACLLMGVAPSEVATARNIGLVRGVLEEVPNLSTAVVRGLDMSHHLRRAYHALYRDLMPGTTLLPGLGQAKLSPQKVVAVGNIIKATKLLRDVWLSAINARGGGSVLNQEMNLSPSKDLEAVRIEVRQRLHLLQRYVSGEWLTVNERADSAAFKLYTEMQRLTEPDVSEEAFAKDIVDRLLAPEQLQTLYGQAKGWLKNNIESREEGPLEPRATDVLCALSRVLESVAPELVREFEYIDQWVFPTELAAGMYELDEIDLVRISPRDPQLPAGIAGNDKVTGDVVAHFSAFFRRDWRTNDIAWGHVDALHQIIRVLLKPKAWARTLQLPVAFDDAQREFETRGASSELRAALSRLAAEPTDPTRLEEFTQRLIIDAQELAMREYTQTLLEDREHQDKLYGWESPPLEKPRDKAVDTFITWRLGARSLLKETPISLLVEYASQAGLSLGHMVKPTLANTKVERPAKNLNAVLRWTLWLTYAVSRSARSEGQFTLLLVFAAVVGGIGFALGSGLAGAWGFAILGGLFSIALTWLAYVCGLRKRAALVWLLVVCAVVASAVGIVQWPRMKTWLADTLVTAGQYLRSPEPTVD
jgi:patatin-related protein